MKKETILVVEDDGILALHLQDMMSNRGYSVLKPVKRGEDAIASAAAHKPDLILMDIHLAGEMNGISAAEKICEVLDIPIVYLTAYSHDALLREVEKTTPYAFLVKPVSEAELIANIQMSLYKHKIDLRLRESEEKFRLITQSSGEIIWQLNLDGKITFVSPAIEKITGYTPEQALTLDFRAFFPETETDRATEVFIKAASGEQYQQLEFVVKRKDGILVPVEISVTPIMKDNKIISIRGITRDITERKQAEAEKEKLEARNRQLQKAESLGRMAGAIAHLFNNQLMVITGNLEMLQEDLAPEANVSENLRSALKAAECAAETSGHMLTFLGQTIGNPVPLDIARTCRTHLAKSQAGIPIGVNIAANLPDPGPVIQADRSQVDQVIGTLVTNAWEALEDTGEVRVAVHTINAADIVQTHRFPVEWETSADSYACLAVTDTGRGMAPETINKIFDPFYTDKFTGRGLGLAVALGCIKSHGGGITVKSKPGRGSTFRVFWPLSSQPLPRPEAPRAVNMQALESGGIVLLVDDQDLARGMAAAMLNRLGFEVITAKDGTEAVDIFRERPEDIGLVLTDLTMPLLNGWETLDAVRKIRPDIPVILSSGYDEAGIMAGDHSEQPEVFLHKPYYKADLKAAIDCALGVLITPMPD